jgi:tetratricopeptide (TPR) repeat protein
VSSAIGSADRHRFVPDAGGVEGSGFVDRGARKGQVRRGAFTKNTEFTILIATRLPVTNPFGSGFTPTPCHDDPALIRFGYSCFHVKLALYIFLVGLAVSWLFRQVEWPWVAFRQGENAFQAGNYLEAATFYERAAEKLTDPRIVERLGTCWVSVNRLDKAEAVLDRLLEQRPDRLAAIKLLAGLYQKEQHPKEAIPLFLKYLSRGGKLDPSAQLQLARIYRQGLLYDEAATYYLQAAQDPKQKTVAEIELADMRSWQGRYDEAVQAFQQVLAAEPSNRQARLSLARVLSWAGRYQDSANEYKRLLSKQ